MRLTGEEAVGITLTTHRQFLCRFTLSCFSTCISLCLECMKPHLPGDFLLSLLRFSSSTTYLDPLSATTCFICISSQYLSHCPFRFFKHVFSTCLRTHRGQTMSHSSFCLEPQSKDVYLPCFGRKPWRLWNLEMESPTKIS